MTELIKLIKEAQIGINIMTNDKILLMSDTLKDYLDIPKNDKIQSVIQVIDKF